MSFMSLKSILPLAVIGRTSNIHRLSPIYLHIFLFVFSLCYKGNHYRKMVYISHSGIMYNLYKIYGIEVSRQQITRAMSKFVSLGLLEQKTAIYTQNINGRFTPVKKSYYRLVSSALV